MGGVRIRTAGPSRPPSFDAPLLPRGPTRAATTAPPLGQMPLIQAETQPLRVREQGDSPQGLEAGSRLGRACRLRPPPRERRRNTGASGVSHLGQIGSAHPEASCQACWGLIHRGLSGRRPGGSHPPGLTEAGPSVGIGETWCGGRHRRCDGIAVGIEDGLPRTARFRKAARAERGGEFRLGNASFTRRPSRVDSALHERRTGMLALSRVEDLREPHDEVPTRIGPEFEPLLVRLRTSGPAACASVPDRRPPVLRAGLPGSPWCRSRFSSRVFPGFRFGRSQLSE